jgi:hypothetical protein
MITPNAATPHSDPRVMMEFVPTRLLGGRPPADLSAWQAAVDEVYRPGFGLVRFLQEADLRWRVHYASVRLPAPYVAGAFPARSSSNRRALIETLRQAGLSVLLF